MPLTPSDPPGSLESTVHPGPVEHYVLRLFVTGMTPRSIRAVVNLRTICNHFLEGRYELEVVDIYQQPILAKGEQIIAAPTLIKKLPLPMRRMVGDMSNRESVLLGLDIAAPGVAE
jgi:circadian clock protein KaiB